MTDERHLIKSNRLENLYRSRSIAELPKHVMQVVIKNLKRSARAKEDIFTKLCATFNDNYETHYAAFKDNESWEERLKKVLNRLKSEKLCRGSWCPLYHHHGFGMETTCPSIGALEEFLQYSKLYDAKRYINDYFHSRSRRMIESIRSLLCVSDWYLEIKRMLSCHKHEEIQVLMDLNTLSEGEIRELYLFNLRKGLKVVPFATPKWEEHFFRGSGNQKWMEFVKKQIRQLNPRSVIVLKLCCGLRSATEPTDDDGEDIRISSTTEAVRYIRYLIKDLHRFSIDVGKSFHEEDINYDDEDDSRLLECEFDIGEDGFAHQDDCTMSKYSFLEGLLMCPYWVTEMERNNIVDVEQMV